MLWGDSAGFRSRSQSVLGAGVAPKAKTRKSPSADNFQHRQECQRADQSGNSAWI